MKRAWWDTGKLRAGLWYGGGLALSLIIICGVMLAFSLLWHRNGGNPDKTAGAPSCTSDLHDTTITFDEAYVALAKYLEGLGEPTYVIKEVIEFEYNFHAVVVDSTTNTGVAELLVDKVGGVVGPEMGPNVMWSSEIIHRGGQQMGRPSMFGQTAITEAEALTIAADWLEAHYPQTVVAAARATHFGRYYTVHALTADGAIEGLLSVHAYTGQVWYHTWHGRFVKTLGRLPSGPNGFPSHSQTLCLARIPLRAWFAAC